MPSNPIAIDQRLKEMTEVNSSMESMITYPASAYNDPRVQSPGAISLNGRFSVKEDDTMEGLGRPDGGYRFGEGGPVT